MSDDLVIEQIDGKGERVTVSRAYWNKYPQLAESFRPVAEKKTTPVVDQKATTVADEPPTGDKGNEIE